MASSPASPPLVWVTQGKSQHSAYLLETRDETCLIRWNTTNQTATVPKQSVSLSLSPRRRRRPPGENASDANDENLDNQLMETTQNQNRSREKRKASPPQGLNQEAKLDSDDEVEVLLTILPPTPKRPKQKASDERNITNMDAETRRVSTSPQPQDETSEPLPLNNDRVARPPRNASVAHSTDEPAKENETTCSTNTSSGQSVTSCLESGTLSTDAVSTLSCREDGANANVTSNLAKRPAASVDLKTATEPQYSFQSSAYVQNLAEICYTILNDARWRVEGTRQRRLVAWEHGEDLSAVSMLSKLYEPTRRKGTKKCQCLICRDKDQEEDCVDAQDGVDASNEHDVADSSLSVDEQTIRALYLYCRLYYRKGPWFRLDKIYTSYYAPSDEASSDGADADNDSQEESRNVRRRGSFFEPLSTGSSSDKQPNTKDGIFIDNDAIEDGLSRVALMLQDVGHLQSIGLVRPFEGEEECGKAAGAVTPEGYGVLLRADERRAIVEKLGGRVKKEKRSSPTARDNIIWKQMCQQRSISFFPHASDDSEGTKSLLPVCRHVDDLLLDNLATIIVMAASRVDYVPKAILRPAVSNVKERIHTMQRIGPDQESRSISMSLKLREAPLLTLRRCARLFLCATSGPGDMRGDGTNAWRSLHDLDMTTIHPNVPLPSLIPPPGSYSWHRVLHPALSCSFGISSFPFLHAHEFLECDGNDDEKKTTHMLQSQVFNTVDSFRLWELSVEIRAQVDYHLELHETLAYAARKKAREEDVENEGPAAKQVLSKGDSCGDECVDFMSILTVGGRKVFVGKLVSMMRGSCHEEVCIDEVCNDIERSISELQALVESAENAETADGATSGEVFKSESERIIIVFAIIISCILGVRHQCLGQKDLASKQSRPWLRHLWFEGILAYALWDCIPLLERKRFHELACSCLEVLLFGKVQVRDTSFLVDEAANTCDDHFDTTPLSQMLVSRRTRGKAHERIMIDYGHLLKWKQKTGSPASNSEDTKTVAKPQDIVRQISSRIVGAVARAGSIPFSAVRSLARRMKQRLSSTFESLPCAEAEALGIRLDNGDTAPVSSNEPGKTSDKYVDWVPPTDFAIANALAGEEMVVGKRCSYVGFEDDAAEAADPSSWNVEELAMKYYATGRLPTNTDTSNDDLAGGGWVGWHDEGGHVRALFRIICAHAILGIDSGCGKESASMLEYLEQLTIHLTPYQGAPFDLHVGHSETLGCISAAAEDATPPADGVSVRSFFQRRRMQIDRFLNKLEALSGQDLCDLVYDSIVSRLDQGRMQDTFVARDLQQVKTLSALAVGFGGQQLSAMFRCLLFDYRHYSGGLPDLLLMRAIVVNDRHGDNATTTSNEKSFVDVSEWIGEEFSAEATTEKETASHRSLLIDKDDEFLGCSKVGDSGGQASSRRWGRRGTKRTPRQGADDTTSDAATAMEKLPARLVLRHNDSNVKVQCLFVEVKSENDRLDGRQEDWLNVLDRVGNARVCKFGQGKKKRPSKRKATSTKVAKKQCTE